MATTGKNPNPSTPVTKVEVPEILKYKLMKVYKFYEAKAYNTPADAERSTLAYSAKDSSQPALISAYPDWSNKELIERNGIVQSAIARYRRMKAGDYEALAEKYSPGKQPTGNVDNVGNTVEGPVVVNTGEVTGTVSTGEVNTGEVTGTVSTGEVNAGSVDQNGGIHMYSNNGTGSGGAQTGDTSADPDDAAVDTGNNNGVDVAQAGDGGGDVGQAEIAGAAAAPPVVDGNESQSALVNQHRHQENRSNMIDYEYSDTNVDIGIMGLSTVYSTYIVLHRDATRFFFTHSDFNTLNTLYVDGDHKKLSNHGKEKYDGLKNEDIAKYSANIVQRYITVFGIEAPRFPAGSDPLDLLWEYNELCQLVSAYNKYTDATVGMYQRQAASAGPAPGQSTGATAPAAGAPAEGASGGLTVTPIINRQVMSGGSSTMGMSTMGTLTANRKRTVYDGQGMPQRQEVRSDNTLVDPQPILSKYSKIAVGDSGVNSGAPFRKLSLNSQGVDFLSTPKNYTGQPLSTSLDSIKNSLSASRPKFLRNPINPTRIFS